MASDRGLDLLEVLKKDSFDCVLLDRQLPDMSGDVVLQWLRQYAEKYTRVIMHKAWRGRKEGVNNITAVADNLKVKCFRANEFDTDMQG